MIVVLDNYDSFTYNLVHLLEGAGAEVVVRWSDHVSVDELRSLSPKGIVVSPGPGRPTDAGISIQAVRELGGEVPILGVCLGHQAVAEAFGGRTVHAPELLHGKTSRVTHDDRGVFEGLPQPFVATRYHSLAVDADSLPASLEATAWSDSGVLMGLRHRHLPIEGVQFHPESILTDQGPALIRNWLNSISSPSLYRVP